MKKNRMFCNEASGFKKHDQERQRIKSHCAAALQTVGSVFGEETYETIRKNNRDFYRHYITAAAHWEHWPTFLHTVTCSTVAGRGGRQQKGGRERLCLSNAAWWRSWERKTSRSSHSQLFYMSYVETTELLYYPTSQ